VLHDEAVEVGLLLDEGEVGVDGADEEVARLRVARQRGRQRSHEVVAEALGQRRNQARAVAEMAVHDGLGDTGLGGDDLHRHRRAVAADDLHRRIEQLLASG
jgi:hypothetical protein